MMYKYVVEEERYYSGEPIPFKGVKDESWELLLTCAEDDMVISFVNLKGERRLATPLEIRERWRETREEARQAALEDYLRFCGNIENLVNQWQARLVVVHKNMRREGLLP
jgi:hypothetical protein